MLQTENLDRKENIIGRENFNCSLNPKLDKKGGVIVPRKMLIDSLECLQNKLDLLDIWTIKNPQTKSYTWSQRLPQIFSRLDYWLFSANLQDFVISTDITPAIKTDHAASELAWTDSYQSDKGSGFWKMNVFLLDDAENYPNELENNFPEWKTTGVNYLSNKLSVWDWLKYNIRNHAISYFKRKAKKRNAKEKILPPAYKEAIKQYEEDPSSVY